MIPQAWIKILLTRQTYVMFIFDSLNAQEIWLLRKYWYYKKHEYYIIPYFIQINFTKLNFLVAR